MDGRLNHIHDELFGRFCLIASGNRYEKYVYRIIRSGTKSKVWSDVPLTCDAVYHPKNHVKTEEVVSVVIDECINPGSKIVSVRRKDIELLMVE